MLQKIESFTKKEKSGKNSTLNKNLIETELKKQWNQSIVRQTVVVEEGLYIFSLLQDSLGWVAEYLFYPHQPEDEAKVQNLVSKCRGDYNELFKIITEWIKNSTFLGYDLEKEEKNIIRVRDLRH